MSVNQAYNFKSINPSVSTAGVLTKRQLSELSSEGYEAVINLLPSDSEYATEHEPSIVEAQGLKYVYIPVDFTAPTESDYQQFTQAMSELSGEKIMLHCAANYRVTAFYSVYATQALGWSAEQARELISSIWDVSEFPVWEKFVESRIDV